MHIVATRCTYVICHACIPNLVFYTNVQGEMSATTLGVFGLCRRNIHGVVPFCTHHKYMYSGVLQVPHDDH